MLHWIWLFIVGLVIGVVAKALMPGPERGGIIVTALLGIAGMIVGDWLAGVVGIAATGSIGSFIVGVVGAIVLLAVYRALSRRR
jgi:uncharacterized membrane protein YeaQ/YmgE (transglycosylase-associated protein family)